MVLKNRRIDRGLGCIEDLKVSYYDIKMCEWKNEDVCCMVVGIGVEFGSKKKQKNWVLNCGGGLTAAVLCRIQQKLGL